MPLDPQFVQLLAGVPAGPGARHVPVKDFREFVRQSMIAFPKLPVPLASVADREIAGPAGPLRLRVYSPQGSGPFPAIVYFHGGGWVVGDLDTQDMIARGLCHGAQAVVVSVEYRLAPEHRFPAGINDAWAATQWVAKNGGELNVDVTKVAVAGDSAGGVIASAIAIRARDEGGPRLIAQWNFYGSCNYPSEVTASAREFGNSPLLSRDDIDYFWELYLADPAKDQHHPWASPIRASDHRGLPPAFIGTAEMDPSRDDTEAYAAKLRSAGVPVELRRYTGMPHGFLAFLGLVDVAGRALDEGNAWLRAQFARVN